MELQPTIQQIDLDKVFREKNPGLYRILPGFVMRYIKRVVHQKEINRILKAGHNRYGTDFADFVIHELGIKVRSKGSNFIPGEGGVIIAGNHPLGGIDGTALITEVAKVRKDVCFIVNELLTNLTNFGDVFVPVNNLGKSSKSNLERVEATYASEQAVLVFPAGLCSRKIRGKIQDLEWHKSFITKAIRYKHPVVPVYVKARNSNWFYNLAKFRNTLGIKVNIEMFYLVDEMFKQRGKSIEFTFAKPIPPEVFDDRHSVKRWSELVREYVYSLEGGKDQDFETFLEHTAGRR